MWLHVAHDVRVHLDYLFVEVSHCHIKWLDDFVVKVTNVLLLHSLMPHPHQLSNCKPNKGCV
jgi:hypothetical protein